MHRVIFVILAAVLFGITFGVTGASARNITSEVQYYKDVSVVFSENAHVCGLKDPEPYVDAMKKRLSAMDVPHNPDSLTDVVLTITASAGGFLRQQCIVHAQLQLRAMMQSAFLNANAYGGQDQTFVMVSERNYVFPMIFYQNGTIFEEYAQTMTPTALKVVDGLMDRLAEARSLK